MEENTSQKSGDQSDTNKKEDNNVDSDTNNEIVDTTPDRIDDTNDLPIERSPERFDEKFQSIESTQDEQNIQFNSKNQFSDTK